MADKNNIISSSKRDIYSKLLDIASGYLEEGKNEDYLKTGLFGYITESMAMMMRDSTIHKGMLYNESFLNTAIMPKSVYNWAKMFGIEVNNAIPAYAEIVITIPKDRVSNSLIIKRENPIIAGDFYFSLEHSIEIRSDGETYTARYMLTEESESTDYQGIRQKTGNWPLIVTVSGNNLNISARAYQYRSQKFIRRISSSSFLNKVQRFTFDDQFAGAKLFYSTSSEKDVPIKLLYSTLNKGAEDTAFAYYNLTDSNEFELVFKAGQDGFIPATNSELKLFIYSTKGSAVPGKFTGDAIIKFSEESMRTIPVIVSFSPSTIIGGRNSPSIEDVKKTIINEISSRNSIITESDLNNYFKIIMDLSSDGRVKFVKRRDDILRRVFSSYILLRDGLSVSGTDVSGSYISRCVPTNTITGKISPGTNSHTSTNSLIGNLSAFPRFKLTGGEYASTTSENDYDYVCPFLIYTTVKPFKKVKYLYNLVDQTVNLNYDRNSKGSLVNVIPESLNIYRGFYGGKANSSYSVAVSLKGVSDSVFTFRDKRHREITLTANFDGTETNVLCSITPDDIKAPTPNDDGTYTYELNFTLTPDSKEFNLDDTAVSNIGTYISLKDTTNTKVDLPEEVYLKVNIDGVTFITENKVSLFKNLDDIMLSDVSIAASESEGSTTLSTISIKDIPVIHKSYFNSKGTTSGNSVHQYFVSQLFNYINLLKENLGKLETSTFFDMKFYNTYGISYLYKNLGTTNIDLFMEITLVSDYTNDQTVKDSILDYIRRMVDMSNENETLKISNITHMLLKEETFGKYISHIDFNGMNGRLMHYTARNKNSEIDYTPEWFNIQDEGHITFA